MKRSVLVSAAVIAAAVALGACTEQPQTLESGVKVDSASFKGTNLPYASPGWKQGDKVSWEQHLKTRTQMGQNEYAKVN
jgi:hypothetical protein